MNAERPHPTTEGPTVRVVVMTPQFAQAYEQVYVQLDGVHPLVHIFSADARTHHLSAPVQACIIEWQDASALSPLPYTPSFGPGAFDRMGEQMNHMMEQMQHGFGRR